MALWKCRGVGCGALVAVGTDQCPQCRGTEFTEEGDETMASINRHGKATDTRAPAAPEVEGGEEAPEAAEEATGAAGAAGHDAMVQAVDNAGGEDGAAPEPPALNASQAEWLAYAKALGHDPADDTTRADLIVLTGHGE